MPRRRQPGVPQPPSALNKPELHELADTLLIDDAAGVARCVTFFADESRGYWHNRARAMIARRLKHCTLTPAQREIVLETILRRLVTGTFTEQFRDQLRLARTLDRERLLAAAHMCADSPRAHVRRLAAWTIAACPPA